ncbi:hypothetical protein [Paenibacillus sp. J2TS4]|uniref:hypothetical protein n=1 Tax=Paenibacillus sp. J2TS4 TaxID=2807194 RepID=UPI001B1BEFB6|nr:hypothetical protein [Paenibacillus sp. J2TS4]GIP36496.1 hypothetical protein J2TS4_57060 [Paenibacillus sp. J2TS4]
MEEQVQYAKTILEGAKVSASIDKKVDSIIKEEVKSYLSGQKSAEEVSKLVQKPRHDLVEQVTVVDRSSTIK